MDRDEREVAARGADERGSEHVASEVVLVRHFEREHCAGRGRFEDRGDAGRGARDEEQPAVLRREESRKPLLERVADRCTEIERRTFETHRRAAPQRCDAGDHAGDERAQRQRVVGVVERVEVFVGGRGRGRRDRSTASASAATVSPTSGASAIPHSGSRFTSSRPRVTADSNPATPTPVITPTTADKQQGLPRPPTADRANVRRLPASPNRRPRANPQIAASCVGHVVQPNFHASSGSSPGASANSEKDVGEQLAPIPTASAP